MDKKINPFSVNVQVLAQQFDEAFAKKDVSTIEHLIDIAKQLVDNSIFWRYIKTMYKFISAIKQYLKALNINRNCNNGCTRASTAVHT